MKDQRLNNAKRARGIRLGDEIHGIFTQRSQSLGLTHEGYIERLMQREDESATIEAVLFRIERGQAAILKQITQALQEFRATFEVAP